VPGSYILHPKGSGTLVYTPKDVGQAGRVLCVRLADMVPTALARGFVLCADAAPGQDAGYGPVRRHQGGGDDAARRGTKLPNRWMHAEWDLVDNHACLGLCRPCAPTQWCSCCISGGCGDLKDGGPQHWQVKEDLLAERARCSELLRGQAFLDGRLQGITASRAALEASLRQQLQQVGQQ